MQYQTKLYEASLAFETVDLFQLLVAALDTFWSARLELEARLSKRSCRLCVWPTNDR